MAAKRRGNVASTALKSFGLEVDVDDGVRVSSAAFFRVHLRFPRLEKRNKTAAVVAHSSACTVVEHIPHFP